MNINIYLINKKCYCKIKSMAYRNYFLAGGGKFFSRIKKFFKFLFSKNQKIFYKKFINYKIEIKIYFN